MSCRIILVEDHHVIRDIFKTFSEKADHCKVVAEAKNGNEALESIKKTPADLIILDLSLPDISGVHVLKEAKKLNSSKFLIITMHNDPGIINEVLDAGADGIVSKDLGPKTLEKAILECLNGERPIYLASL